VNECVSCIKWIHHHSSAFRLLTPSFAPLSLSISLSLFTYPCRFPAFLLIVYYLFIEPLVTWLNVEILTASITSEDSLTIHLGVRFACVVKDWLTKSFWCSFRGQLSSFDCWNVWRCLLDLSLPDACENRDEIYWLIISIIRWIQFKSPISIILYFFNSIVLHFSSVSINSFYQWLLVPVLRSLLVFNVSTFLVIRNNIDWLNVVGMLILYPMNLLRFLWHCQAIDWSNLMNIRMPWTECSWFSDFDRGDYNV